MSEVFLKIVNMSISASWLILAVLVLRLVLKKAPKWVNVLLWGIVALRLLLPFSLESVFSLIPSGETIPSQIMLSPAPTIHSGIEAVNTMVNPIIIESLAPAAGASMNPLQFWIPLLSLIWAMGAALMLIWVAVSYLRLRRKVATAVLLQENIYQSEAVTSPFVLGIVKPKIYLPFSMEAPRMELVIAHEQAHILRKDHWWKPLGFLLLTIHWFNPLIWLSYALLCRDIEFACDEKVIAALDEAQRADYSEALLSCCAKRSSVVTCPVAFGETGVRSRIKSVLSYKKPALWLIIAALLFCIFLCICFLTNPITANDALTFKGQSPDNEKILLYHIDLGHQVTGGKIHIEQWMDGRCVSSEPLSFSPNDQEIQIQISEEKKGDKISIGELQLRTDTQSEPLTILYPAANVNFAIASSVSTYKENKTVRIRPGDEKILAAMVFDEGDGIPEIDCNSLEKEPDLLTTIKYVIVVRACFEPIPPESIPTLSLNDIIILSQKGDDLTPEDFASYAHDIYTRNQSDSPYGIYKINDLFSFDLVMDSLGGIYMLLRSHDAQAESIDIRLGSDTILEFIDRHKDNAPIAEVSFHFSCCPIGHNDELFDKMVEFSSQSENLRMDSPQSLPVAKFTSEDEWNEFRRVMGPYLDGNRECPEGHTFNKLKRQYRQDFFTESTLFVLYIPANDISFRPEISHMQISESILSIGVGVMAPPADDPAPEGWFMFFYVPTEQLSQLGGYTELDAQIVSTQFPYVGTENANPTRTYVFADTVAVVKPSVTLFDNGWFTFKFSAHTHYQGTGPYEIENGRLILRTYDGQFVYIFDMVEDHLQFDAISSSEELWSSKLYDGAILK